MSAELSPVTLFVDDPSQIQFNPHPSGEFVLLTIGNGLFTVLNISTRGSRDHVGAAQVFDALAAAASECADWYRTRAAQPTAAAAVTA